MEASVRKLFERYESLAKSSLLGDVDVDQTAALYAAEFIAASPAGVVTGKNTRAAQAGDCAGPKVFGWVSGDEQTVLKEHGIV